MKLLVKIVFVVSTILLTSFSSHAIGFKAFQLWIEEYNERDFSGEYGYDLLLQETINLRNSIKEDADITTEKKEQLLESLLDSYISNLEKVRQENPEIEFKVYNDGYKFWNVAISLGYSEESFMLLGDEPIKKFIQNYRDLREAPKDLF